MNKFQIEVFYGPDTELEEVDAHKCLIMGNGQLKFVNQQGNLIKAYNKDAWFAVEQMFEEPTPVQIGEPLFDTEDLKP